jgi:glycyl-tRNA synthetase (class II)
VRDRDSLAQERLPIGGVRAWLEEALAQPWTSPKGD